MTALPSRKDVESDDTTRQLAVAIAKLSRRTQLVLALYYQEECAQAEIGEILDMTEGRVCRILSAVTKRLRGKP